MILRRGWARLVLEGAFIILVAALTRLFGLSTAWIIILVLFAWVLTAIVERSASQRAPLEVAGVEPLVEDFADLDGDGSVSPNGEPPLPEPEPEPERARPRPRPGPVARTIDWLESDRRRAKRAERRRRAHDPKGNVPLRRLRARPIHVDSRACSTCGRAIPVDRLLAIPDATQCLDCKRGEAIPASAGEAEGVVVVSRPPVADALPEPEPEPVEVASPVAVIAQEPEPAPVEREPEPVAAPVRVAAAPRGWNVWELERLARERAGEDVLRDEEWHFLLVYLREFADASGNLPPDFDGLVRESFAELIG